MVNLLNKVRVVFKERNELNTKVHISPKVRQKQK